MVNKEKQVKVDGPQAKKRTVPVENRPLQAMIYESFLIVTHPVIRLTGIPVCKLDSCIIRP